MLPKLCYLPLQLEEYLMGFPIIVLPWLVIPDGWLKSIHSEKEVKVAAPVKHIITE